MSRPLLAHLVGDYVLQSELIVDSLASMFGVQP